MQLADYFEWPPNPDDLLYSIEHWTREDIEASGRLKHTSQLEAFVHPDTATAACIHGAEPGPYSVQTTQGDYADGDCVVQPDDAGAFLSGPNTVILTDVESLPEARVVAWAWLRGWLQRNRTIGDTPGDIHDAGVDLQAEAIE